MARAEGCCCQLRKDGPHRSGCRQGKLDFVQVRNWGQERDSAGQPKLENLEVDAFSQQDADTAGPLYTVLAKRLQLLEVCQHAAAYTARFMTQPDNCSVPAGKGPVAGGAGAGQCSPATL